jgi:hypothetical protein
MAEDNGGKAWMFTEWRAARRWVERVDFEGREGDAVAPEENCGPAWVYPECCGAMIDILKSDGGFYLCVQNIERFSTELQDLECFLYNWLIDEGKLDGVYEEGGERHPYRPPYVLSFRDFRYSRSPMPGGGSLALDPVDGWDQATAGDKRPRPCVYYGIPGFPDGDPSYEIAGPHPDTGLYFVCLDRKDYEGDLAALEWVLYRWLVEEREIQDPDA